MKRAVAIASTSINVAEAKRGFSDLVGRVAHAGESFVITLRGRPMAQLVPLAAETKAVGEVRGFLEDDDPFFEVVDEIVSRRAEHVPRALRSGAASPDVVGVVSRGRRKTRTR
jgi:prevent-host-death family protein